MVEKLFDKSPKYVESNCFLVEIRAKIFILDEISFVEIGVLSLSISLTYLFEEFLLLKYEET